MKSRKQIAVLVTCLCALLGQSVCLANEGFPGTGDPADWSDALPYYNGGNRYLNAGRFAEAVERYKQAISRYQYEPDFYINLGVAYRKLEDYPNAEQAFLQATRLSPKDWMAWSNLGNAYLKQNRLKETVSAFQSALKCNPPASEVVAMKRDIADITKIMNMQGGNPAAVPAKNSPDAAVRHSAKAKTTQKQAPSPEKPAATALSAPKQPAENAQQMHESGWDWINTK